MTGVPKFPKTRLVWCTDCGERLTERRGAPYGYLKGYHYYVDDHACPRTCPHCQVAYHVIVGGMHGPKDDHTCPGREQAIAKGRASIQRLSKELNRIFFHRPVARRK